MLDYTKPVSGNEKVYRWQNLIIDSNNLVDVRPQEAKQMKYEGEKVEVAAEGRMIQTSRAKEGAAVHPRRAPDTSEINGLGGKFDSNI
ncbi:MAG: hypothetical protein KJ879_03070 [Nanoarchaeota archaeon]|nr:hypothetical protein [Nanoarchaeota archaeon]